MGVDPVSSDEAAAPLQLLMTHTIEISDDLRRRIENHLEDDETIAEFIEELVSMYETEGAFIQEGYSE